MVKKLNILLVDVSLLQLLVLHVMQVMHMCNEGYKCYVSHMLSIIALNIWTSESYLF